MNILLSVLTMFWWIQRSAMVTRWDAGTVAVGCECCVARRAIWTAREVDASAYLEDSGSSDKRAQISRRRLLNDWRLGDEDVGCIDIENSLYKRRQSCTEMRSRKSFLKLLRRGISNRNVAGMTSAEEGASNSI